MLKLRRILLVAKGNTDYLVKSLTQTPFYKDYVLEVGCFSYPEDLVYLLVLEEVPSLPEGFQPVTGNPKLGDPYRMYQNKELISGVVRFHLISDGTSDSDVHLYDLPEELSCSQWVSIAKTVSGVSEAGWFFNYLASGGWMFAITASEDTAEVVSEATNTQHFGSVSRSFLEGVLLKLGCHLSEA